MRLSTTMRSAAAVAALALTATACAGTAAAFESLADAGEGQIGVQSSTTGESFATDNAPDTATIVAFEDAGTLFTALQAGTVDAVLQDLPVNAEFARNNEGFSVVEEFETGESYGFAVAEEGAENLLVAVNAALGELKGDGFYDAVFTKYFGTAASDADTELPTVEAGTSDGVELITAGTLTVCSDLPYPPFEFEDADAPSGYSGFDIDLVQAISTKLGLELAVIVSGFDPIQSGIAMATGQCDLAASAMTITEEREANLDFTDGYYDAKQSLLVANA
ncbi:MAG: ABC-type amino acid transport substrate-binding protein [Myxococcota bacterium]|jgi:ABC-type amino acid transport substrate-binding protein